MNKCSVCDKDIEAQRGEVISQRSHSLGTKSSSPDNSKILSFHLCNCRRSFIQGNQHNNKNFLSFRRISNSFLHHHTTPTSSIYISTSIIPHTSIPPLITFIYTSTTILLCLPPTSPLSFPPSLPPPHLSVSSQQPPSLGGEAGVN